MKIASVQIQKFRSVDDATIRFPHILALVGANNAGKSHILRGLNAFFNFEQERIYFINGDHLYSKHSRPKITVIFDSITEADGIEPQYINGEKLTIRFTYRWDRNSPLYEIITHENKTIDVETFKRLTHRFAYIYVPILRNYKTAFSAQGGTAYQLLKQIFQQQTSNRNIFSSSERQLIKKVEGSIYQPTIGKIKQFYPFADEHDFVMRTQNADIIDLILHNVSLMLLEDSQENSLDNCGSGIQSAVFFAISIALSMTEGINYLVGIEEPELNMHPQAQRKLIDTLQKREKYPNTQFVLTSHSTVIIDRLGHESIALCRKNKGEKRDVITTVSQVSPEFLRNYAIDKERYYNFFDFRNSDFFFSNFIIITESTKDCKVVQHLLELNGIDTEDKGISLIPVDGERNIKYPYSIAKELCIPFICVVDRDVFQPYLNNERKQSLDKNGLPQYKNELKASSPIIDFISPNDKDSLILAFSQNDYKNVIKILDKYNIVAMRFAFEIDLAICPSFCNTLYTILNVEEGKRNLSTLLTEKSNVLKDFLTLNSALDSQGIRNLPKSYRQIIINVKNGVNSSKR